MKFKFTKTADDQSKFDSANLTMETSAVYLPDILKDFEDFLKGCGFVFEGSLEVVEPESNDAHAEEKESTFEDVLKNVYCNFFDQVANQGDLNTCRFLLVYYSDALAEVIKNKDSYSEDVQKLIEERQ